MKRMFLLFALANSSFCMLAGKTALISVSDKTGIVELVQSLLHNGYDKIISTGGTYKAIYNNLEEQDQSRLVQISHITNFPEILNGRVKTLHPTIHGGVLAKHDDESMLAQMEQHNIDPIHLVVVNLYPFKQVIALDNCTEQEAIENIDIGGVALIRAAAKNYEYVTVITDPADYQKIIENPHPELAVRREFAFKAFKHTALYDAAISGYLSDGNFAIRSYEKITPLRYGLNPHQKNAGLYTVNANKSPYQIINGTPGYINMLDINRSWGLVWEAQKVFNMPCAASFKHTSPAGAALDNELARAVQKALDADPVSSFGNIIAVSEIVDQNTAEIIKAWVCDGIVAIGFTDAALDILSTKKNGKFLIVQADPDVYDIMQQQFKELDGNVAISQDPIGLTNLSWEQKTDVAIPQNAKKDLEFANIVVKYCESNSVAIVKDLCAVGMGTGQQNRLQCIELAVEKAAHWFLRQHPRVRGISFKKGTKRTLKNNAIAEFLKGEVNNMHFTTVPEPLEDEEREAFLQFAEFSLASDAFMPFADNVEAAKYVKYIIQPGGSIRDQEVINACQEREIGLVFTGMRLFNH